MTSNEPLAILDNETRQELRDIKLARDTVIQVAQALSNAINGLIGQLDSTYTTTLRAILRQNKLDLKTSYDVNHETGEIKASAQQASQEPETAPSA